MKQKLSILFFLLFSICILAQSQDNEKRINYIKNKLQELSKSTSGLLKTVDFNVSNIELPTFIRAVGEESNVNISVEPQLSDIVLSHNFSDAKVEDILLYLCKEYSLTLNFTGNIISLKKYIPKKKKIKPYVSRNILVDYDSADDLLSVELKNDSLSIAFKKITDVSGKNLVFAPTIASKKISGYIKSKPFDSAMDKLAFANGLTVTKTKDNYYLFESNYIEQNEQFNIATDGNTVRRQRPSRYRNNNFFYKVTDRTQHILEVDFENTDISAIIKDIGYDLKINMFTNAPLSNIGTASVKASNISFDFLLKKILEDTQFTYKKRDNIYFFGKREQASLQSTVIIPLLHRSIETMNEPMQSRRSNFNSNYSSGTIYGSSTNNINNQNSGNFNQQNNSVFDNNRNQRFLDTQNNQSFGDYQSKSEALINILPRELVQGLEVKTDVEQNSFIVTGDAQKVDKFKTFISKVDKPVPVILIEVMILEVSNSNAVSAGVELGLAEKQIDDKGTLFSSTDLTLGSKSINKIIGGFNGFGSLNVGRVVPNFFARIQAMETNGNVKIKSTPKLSTLNGHRATLSNGERSYYAVTRRDIIGTQNPQTREIKNYVPINADLSISLRPLVSGDEQITLSINVAQSSFNGKRIDAEAPPGMNSREFTSTIRVRDQDVIILGGLEENLKNDSGSGVPFLARIPIIKWLFSKRTRRASKSKLSVLIKPTIIR